MAHRTTIPAQVCTGMPSPAWGGWRQGTRRGGAVWKSYGPSAGLAPEARRLPLPPVLQEREDVTHEAHMAEVLLPQEAATEKRGGRPCNAHTCWDLGQPIFLLTIPSLVISIAAAIMPIS